MPRVLKRFAPSPAFLQGPWAVPSSWGLRGPLCSVLAPAFCSLCSLGPTLPWCVPISCANVLPLTPWLQTPRMTGSNYADSELLCVKGDHLRDSW